MTPTLLCGRTEPMDAERREQLIVGVAASVPPIYRSNRPALTRAYPPSWFTGRLVSLKTRWEELNPSQASDQLSLAL